MKTIIKQISITSLITIALLLGGHFFFMLLNSISKFIGVDATAIGFIITLTWLGVFFFVKGVGVK